MIIGGEFSHAILKKAKKGDLEFKMILVELLKL